MTHLRRLIAALVLPLAIALFLSEPASAGTYTVHGCRLPSGAVAPANGWVGSSIGAWVTVSNTCASGGSLGVGLDSGISHHVGDEAKWTFAAPADTRIVGFSGHRASRVGTGQTNGSPEVIVGADTGYLERCARLYGCDPGAGDPASAIGGANSFSYSLDAGVVYVVAVCGGQWGHVCPGENPSAQGSLFRSSVSLSDGADPQPSGVTGSLTEDGPHRGKESITFNVTDRGAGVYRGIVEVNSVPVLNEILSANDGKCADAEPGDGDPYQFLERVPCKLSLNATQTLDTTQLSEGAHTIRVRVVDAAGNASTVHGPAKFEVRNQTGSGTSTGGGSGGSSTSSPAQGSATHTATTTSTSSSERTAAVPRDGQHNSNDARLIVAFERNGSRMLTTPYGSRVVIRGRVVNHMNLGIGGARVDIAGRNADFGWSLQTRADGRFSVKLPRHLPSQRLRVMYRTHSGAEPAATATLNLKVKAGIRLSVTPRKVRNRQAITFRGRLLGKPFPRAGKLIEVQVRFPGGWRTFATVKAGRNGVFRYRYRFMRTTQPITYKFRVRSRRDGAYPYDTGTSRIVRVRVG